MELEAGTWRARPSAEIVRVEHSKRRRDLSHARSMVRGWVPRRDGHDGVDADADVTLTWLKANDWRRRRDVTLT